VNSLERMKLVLNGARPDRVPFVPSIYEHGAAVIGVTPSQASTDADLMARAAVDSFMAYGHDLITVGIDIYNIEAEAFGCPVKRFSDRSIPAIDGHPLGELEILDAAELRVPEEGARGNRLGLIIDACRRVMREVGEQTVVYACMGGPFSQAVELRGFDRFIMDIYERPSAVHELLEKTTALSISHARRLSSVGVGVNVYESWATLPLISPDIFRDFVVPYEKRIIRAVKERYPTPAPAVIMGGDTSILIDFFIEVGTSLVVADYMTDFSFMKEKIQAAGSGMVIRGCLDPKQIERGDWAALEGPIRTLAQKSKGMNNYVWGCGCVPLDTPREYLLRFKEMCLSADPGEGESY
jgi:uroporphyrinogen decarboxylase